MTASLLTRDPIAPGPFEPSWDSLRGFACPAWFADAKFGIWAHWGPQCVPMSGDWYARRMYIPGDRLYAHHWRTYGHPSKTGYKDIVRQWKAERFDPDGLMDLYRDAGARYFVAQAAHHDNFDNWNSRHHRWNAVQEGPHRDIAGEWVRAARARGLRVGFSEHLGASFRWMVPNKGADADGPYAGVPYDGNDPAYEDLYQPNRGETGWWYTDNPWWHERWFLRIKDLIDQHHPDLLYSDGGVPFDEVGLHIIAHLYNTSAAAHGGVNDAVYTQKDKNPQVHPVGVMDIERGYLQESAAAPWQTDTCVGGWFYDVRQVYKTADHVITMLVDIVSKNGNLLLNFPQRPDGTLDEECVHILRRLREWMGVHSEAIHGTRPWRVFGEGPSGAVEGGAQDREREWSANDFRFTAKGDVVYAFQMAAAEGEVAIASLGGKAGGRVADVRLLGHGGDVAWEQREQALVAHVPAGVAGPVACLRVTSG